LSAFKNKIIFNFVKFLATKKGMTTNFFHPPFLFLFLDPGSGMGKNQDPNTGFGTLWPAENPRGTVPQPET
jgi:hypothetical protein